MSKITKIIDILIKGRFLKKWWGILDLNGSRASPQTRGQGIQVFAAYAAPRTISSLI
jgi:hypothetical protein